MKKVMNYVNALSVVFKNGMIVNTANNGYSNSNNNNNNNNIDRDICLCNYFDTILSNTDFSRDRQENVTICNDIVSIAAAEWNVSIEVATTYFLYTVYKHISATHDLILIADNTAGELYAAACGINELINYDCFSLDYDSKNKSAALRLRISKNLKNDIISIGEKIAPDYKAIAANKGRAAEFAIQLYYDTECNSTYDNIPFYDTGDIYKYGMTLQIKAHKASICNMNQIALYLSRFGYNPQYSCNIPVIPLECLSDFKTFGGADFIQECEYKGKITSRVKWYYTSLNKVDKFKLYKIYRTIAECDNTNRADLLNAYRAKKQLYSIAADNKINLYDLIKYFHAMDK